MDIISLFCVLSAYNKICSSVSHFLRGAQVQWELFWRILFEVITD